jgi:hypothetical protein
MGRENLEDYNAEILDHVGEWEAAVRFLGPRDPARRLDHTT